MSLVNEPHYNLKDFFITATTFMEKGNYTVKYDFRSKLKEYEHTLKSLPFDSPIIPREDHYERDIFYLSSSYTLFWNIPKLNKIIKANSIAPQPISTHQAYDIVDKTQILPSHLNKSNNSPIIVALIPFTSTPFTVVDGNHRVVTNYLKHKPFISAYIISPHLHVSAMPSKFLQTIFKISYNILLINEYMAGNLPYDEFDHNIFLIS